MLALPLMAMLSIATHQIPLVQASSSMRVVDLGYAKYQSDLSFVEGVTSFLGLRYAAPPTGTQFYCFSLLVFSCLEQWVYHVSIDRSATMESAAATSICARSSGCYNTAASMLSAIHSWRSWSIYDKPIPDSVLA